MEEVFPCRRFDPRVSDTNFPVSRMEGVLRPIVSLASLTLRGREYLW